MAEQQRLEVCTVGDIELDDIFEVTHDGQVIAVYRTEDDEYFATDGLCTHENVSLADGLLQGFEIECPRHNGVFDIRTGAAKRAPACINLNTYRVEVQAGKVFVVFTDGGEGR
ncbi:Rieske 2Fe-2S domain-containing protein [Roseisalinus antarcticus]|nr:Rieske 2Fe-2S domain-containing protein [Roseisalinus antarcticus]